jgi:hypothetical protein
LWQAVLLLSQVHPLARSRVPIGHPSYVALRTLFLAFLTQLESRYLVPLLPVMELVLIVAIPNAFQSNNALKKSLPAP